MKRILCAGMVSALALASAAAADIKIAHVYGKTGPFEAYAKQSHDGLMLGLELRCEGKSIYAQCLRKGLLINCTHQRVLRIMPQLGVSKKEIDSAVETLDSILQRF